MILGLSRFELASVCQTERESRARSRAVRRACCRGQDRPSSVLGSRVFVASRLRLSGESAGPHRALCKRGTSAHLCRDFITTQLSSLSAASNIDATARDEARARCRMSTPPDGHTGSPRHRPASARARLRRPPQLRQRSLPLAPRQSDCLKTDTIYNKISTISRLRL